MQRNILTKLTKLTQLKQHAFTPRGWCSCMSGDFLRLMLRICANDRTLASKAVARPRKNNNVTWQQTNVTA